MLPRGTNFAVSFNNLGGSITRAAARAGPPTIVGRARDSRAAARVRITRGSRCLTHATSGSLRPRRSRAGASILTRARDPACGRGDDHPDIAESLLAAVLTRRAIRETARAHPRTRAGRQSQEPRSGSHPARRVGLAFGEWRRSAR
jgi:hypothetical protein